MWGLILSFISEFMGCDSGMVWDLGLRVQDSGLRASSRYG